MHRRIQNNAGFTVVEMMVAVLIAGTITAAIASFLMIHIKSYESTKNIIDLQYEAQLALNQMAKIAMESTGVSHIDQGTSQMTSVNAVALNNTGDFIAFETIEEDGSSLYHIYTLENNSIVSYSTSTYNDLIDPTDYGIFVKNITAMTFRPGKNDSTSNENFAEARSLEIKFQLDKKDSDLSVQTQVKFRNK
ncbi:MAG: hypothetical protein CVV02_09850 [Firmicutes bacterium HGW-Firmicutes-7]|nr:MAG: hypothetical protein CVV02_09850 [Firmicutes bacterium HGW-Firmicutes-7]